MQLAYTTLCVREVRLQSRTPPPSLIVWPSITILYISDRNSPKSGGPLPQNSTHPLALKRGGKGAWP